MIAQNASHSNPFDAGLYRGVVLGAFIGAVLWELNRPDDFGDSNGSI